MAAAKLGVGPLRPLLVRRGALLFRSITVVVVLAALQQVSGKLCKDCYAFPNTCPTNSTLTDISAFQGTASPDPTCPDASTCCVPANFNCTLQENIRCSNSWQSKCPEGTWDRFSGPDSNTSCVSSCPTNFERELPWTLFCVAQNCFTVAGYDTTLCTSCDAGYRFVQDGSCQLPPQYSFMIRDNRTNFTLPWIGAANQTALANFSTDTRSNTKILNVSVELVILGSQTRFSTDVLAPPAGNRTALVPGTGFCTIGGNTSFFPSTNATIVMNYAFPLGVTLVNCTATDRNGLSSWGAVSVLIVDTEAPRVTCPANKAADTHFRQNYFFFNFSRSLNATQAVDNIGVNVSICTGNGGGNNFTLSGRGSNTFPIICTTRDTALNTANCTYNVVVTDREAPRVTCPPSRFFSAANNVNFTTGTNITFATNANSVDNVGISSNTCVMNGVTVSLNAATQYQIGMNNITCTARDFANNATSCTFSVTVFDTQPPILTCPNVTVPTLFNQPFATQALTVPASDNSYLPVNVSCFPGGFPSAANFMVGNTTVNCTGVDRSGNVGWCLSRVTVVDQTPPIITCPPPMLLDMDLGTNSTTTTYQAVATDNVNVTRITCSPPSGSRFFLGATIVTCAAFDAANNSVTCQSNVVVQDNQVPLVTCPSSQIIPSNLSANITVSFAAPTASDNLGVASTQLQVAAAAPLVDGILNGTNYTFARAGTATFTFYAYDLVENSNLCFWSITVLPPVVIPDTKIPNITGCPTNITTTTPTVLFSSYPPSTYTIVRTTIWDRSFTNITLPTLNATDESGVTAMYLDWSANPQTTFFAGTYVVAYKAVDPSGNTAYCVYRVQVLDPQPPRWTNCPISMTSRTGPGRNSAPALSWPPQGIIAVDNVQVVDQYGSCQSTPRGFCPPSGAISTANYSVGTVVFNYTAVDTSGNFAPACIFSVTVIDDDPPQLSGCPTQPLQTRTNPGVNYSDISNLCPNFTYTDNVGIWNTSLTSSPPGYTCSSQIPIMNGLSFIFRVTDTSGLVSSCLFTISVLDLEKPSIPQCPLNTLSFSADTDPGSSLAFVNYTNLTAVDNSGSASITSLSFPVTDLKAGSYFPLGVTSILYNALDPSLNGASCIVVVTVADKEPPTIFNCPSQNFVLPNDPGKASAWLVLPDLNATDNVRIQGAAFFPYYFEPGENFTFAIGLTPLEYTAQDTSFNKASCAFSVRVEDREPPTFTGCPLNVQFNLTADQGLPSTVFRFPVITVADNFDPVSIFSISSSPLGFTDGSPFIVGRTRVTLSSTDRAGNQGLCEFFVNVADTQPPVITCPDNQLFQTLNPTDTLAPVTWRLPIVTDNYFVVSVVSNLVPGNWSLGTYVVNYTSSDFSGNQASCSFNVTVTRMRTQNLETSSAGASTTAFAGAGGGAGLLLILLVCAILFMRRSHRETLQRAVSGYAEFLAMSDELILERARAIQQALLEQRVAKPPRLLETEFVHPDRKFAAPPSTLEGLKAYMRDTCNKEIDRQQLEMGSELGAGEFGSVYDGFCVYGDKGRTKVAIKMLKQATEDASKVQFLKEAAIMAQFTHPNIVELVGVCTLPEDEPTLIVLEFMHLGSLYSYLQSPMVRGNLEVLTMVRMALDIAAGMQYLAEAGFVHRDLAARNVLLDKSMTCRIGDFGLSIDLAANSPSNAKTESIYGGADELPAAGDSDANLKIPIRWTAIEAIMFKQFSSASDVWSFGITLWEIFSYAELPYKGMANKKVIEEVSKGYRMPKPDGCPYDVYRLMIECWDSNVKRRITFYKAHTALVQIWKDLDRSSMLPEDGGAGGTLYETQNGMEPDQMLYGTGKQVDAPSDDEDGDYATAANRGKAAAEDDYALAAGSPNSGKRDTRYSTNVTGSNELYDIGTDNDGYGAAVHRGQSTRARAPAAPQVSSPALYDMGVDPVAVMQDLLGDLPGSTVMNNPLFERSERQSVRAGATTESAAGGSVSDTMRRGSAGQAGDDGYLLMMSENAL